MKVLVLNCGSSSLKYKLYDDGAEQRAGLVERIPDGGHEQALQGVLDELSDQTIDAVGHRVVHGGARFADAARIDDAVRADIEACIALAPLHNPANLAGIDAAMARLPDVPHVAVFDTAFHARLPRRARSYGIDPTLADKHHIRRYGFHGPSHAFVAQRAAEQLGRPLEELRLITCHLGNGASVCAVECGRSVETSMGMTPLEGLVMGTRSGDIDAGALIALLKSGAMTVDELDHTLNKQSGLKGLSGISNDVRDIEKAAAEGDERARLAIAVFTHRLRKYIGAYAAVMGGVDAVIMTGGIGQNSATMRRRALQRFEYLGLLIDEEKNAGAQARHDRTPVVDISEDHSRVRSLVIATDEERMIADETRRVAGGGAEVQSEMPIPIAVSARHIHLTREAMDALFGPGSELTSYRPLSQPGQFACHERLNIVGPRGRIDGVRILGPLRPACQVEISRTDEFHLGVDAPVRHSGDVKGTAPIILEGPKGTLHLQEGLICAWRHIHMHPDDAARYGVKDRDEVMVEIRGGDRDLIFADVVVRVSPKYALEMHIDTDEANAAELPPKSEGSLVGVEGRQAVLLKRKAWPQPAGE